MSRKTLFNSPPAADSSTIQQKLRQVQSSVRIFLERHPLHLLTLMLICLLCSGILAFTIMRKNTSHSLPSFPNVPTSGALNGLPNVMGTYDALQKVTAIQDTIAAIIAKEKLNSSDSIRLTAALKRFEQLQKIIYHQNNNP